MAFANVPGIFILLLYLKDVYGQQGMMNNMGFNGPPGPSQSNLQNFNNFNQVPMNPTAGNLNYNMPQQNIPSQANMQSAGNFQAMKQQANLQPPNKPANNLQQQLSVQQFNMQKSNTAPAANLQLPRQTNQLQATDMNLAPSPNVKANGNPSQGPPFPLQITSWNFIPVEQMPNPPQSQMSFVSNSPGNTFRNQGPPPSLQNIPNVVAQNAMVPQQNQQASYPSPQNSYPSLQNQIISVLGNQQPFSPPCMASIQNQHIPNAVQNQPSFNPMQGPAILTMQALPASFVHNQPGVVPVQGQPILTSLTLQNQPPANQNQGQSVITYQNQPGVSMYPGSSSYLPISSQYIPPIPVYTPYPPYANPTPKPHKSSSLKTILPYILSLLQDRQRGPCPNCGCVNDNQEPQIFGGYANQKNYGSLLNEQSLPVMKIDEEDIQTSNRFLREHKSPKKNVVNTESEEISDEDTAEVPDEGEDNTSDSE